MGDAKHPLASLYASEIVTLGLLYALKGGGRRAFWWWLARDYRPLFPNLPDRISLFRLFNSLGHYAQRFLASPSLIGVLTVTGLNCYINPRRAQ